MRTLVVGMVCSFILVFQPVVSDGSVLDKQTVIIEVDGDPHKRAEELKEKDGFLEILAVYDTLLQGVAVKGKQTTIQKLLHVSYVRTLHPVQQYEAVQLSGYTPSKDYVLPNDVHSTSFTGKGVKVGVVDTGIDYTHKDLQKNYQGGFDVVDFDQDPMESLVDAGMPTLHGTHVAGIIAANGELLGVAPDAEIHAYRALGPGGQGTSVQVIAAMEEAVKDEVDILNLSLGNTINGPDFPTSIAVNKAEELGVITVIANGNAGPETWTIGSPATASQTLSVGALDQTHSSVSLYEPTGQINIPLIEMMGSIPWSLTKDYPLIEWGDEGDMRGTIVLAKRDDVPFTEKARFAQDEGAVALLVYDSESDDDFQGSIVQEERPITIPVSSINKQTAERLLEQKHAFIETKYTQVPDRVASFSSRGPVTMDWQIKPDIVAPGARILSTVPGGYAELQGTSMAAPHVAGGLALLKEAHPTWTNKQLIASLLTTAKRLQTSEGVPFLPIEQGMGTMNIDEAVKTKTLIHDSKLSFGKVTGFKERKKAMVTVENISSDEQSFHFSIPKKTKGMQWNLPMPFTIKPNETKDIPITIDVTHLVDDGLEQGWINLHQEDNLYHLPYLFVSQEADQPKTMGFDFYKDPIKKKIFTYQMYVTEEVNTFIVDLYDPESLLHKGTLLQVDHLEAGMNEGSIPVTDVPYEGSFIAVLSMHLASGEIEHDIVKLVITSEE